MSTIYPNGIDNAITLPIVFDNITEVTADTVNRIRDAILSIENSLGVNPQGTYTITGGVSARLANIDSEISTLTTAVANVVNEVDVIISSLDGEGIKLGTPVGGFLAGITTLQSVTPITEAINTFNNIMSFLAPAQPQSINGLAVDAVTSIPVFSGKPATLTSPPTGYYGPFPAGSVTSRLTKTQAFTLTTHTTGDATTGFSDADKGIMAIFVNGVQVETFNLGTAFDETQRANLSGQGVTYSGNTGSASPPLKALGSYLSPPSGVTGSTQIYSIALFNSFPLWQKGVARIVNLTLAPGYNNFQFKHTVGSSVRTSQLFELFYDNGAANPTFASTPLLSITGTPTHFNFLSGIKFLTTSESLTLNATINNAFVNTYIQAPVTCAFTIGINSATIDLADSSVQVPPSNNPSAPNVADQLVIVSKVFPITILNQQSVNQIVTVTYTNVYGATFQAQSAAQNLLLNTYNSAASTANTESFVDESRRLLPDINGATGASAPYPNDYVGIPPVITSQWTSTAALINGNAQSFNAHLIYPTGDFTTGYVPAQSGSANYSGFNNTNSHNGQVYYRAMFANGNPRSTGTLTINGINLLDLTQFSPNLKVEMKLPSITGWLDFSLPFNNGTFTGATGQGCRTGNSGSVFGWSAGSLTTASSGFMYILRITLFNTSRPIASLLESFTQTF